MSERKVWSPRRILLLPEFELFPYASSVFAIVTRSRLVGSDRMLILEKILEECENVEM